MRKDSRSSQRLVKSSKLVKKPSKKRVGVSSSKTAPGKKSKLNGCLTTLGVISAFIAAGGIIIGGIWLAILLMINPNAIVWLNQFLPEWTRIPIASNSPPQTLAAIQDELRKNGFTGGEFQSLKDDELLLPVFSTTPNCQTDCEKIVELRVYHTTKSSSDQKYQLVSQLAIAGPQEFFALATGAGNKGNSTLSRALPLTKINPFNDKAPGSGFWFILTGQRTNGDPAITYGQIVHYNPEQMHLSVMVQWTSPNEFLPSWQQITGNITPEFVINQTAGLEPKFKVYQLKPRPFVPDPIYLQEISLVQPAIDTPLFHKALMLARSGLWSPARQLLLSQKKQKWSANAQVQLDIIQLHAQLTETQAKQAWASPSQQIYANLLDGRWADALLVFQSSESGLPVQEIATMLKTDSGTLWERVTAALKVSDDSNLKAWGVLMVAAQQNREKAIAYFQQLQKNQTTKSETNLKINELLDHLEDTAPANNLNRTSQLIGTAQPIPTVNAADWLQLEPTPKAKKALPPIKPGEQWYQIQLSAFNDGRRWQQMPFTKLKLPKAAQAKQLWNYLGLNTESQIQIAVWTPEGQQESVSATVKGVSYQGGVIQLLVAGEALPTLTFRSRPLAYTEGALNWLEPASVTITDLNQLQPKTVSALLPALWRELMKSGQIKSGAMPSLQIMLGEMGYWSVRLVDLTGNNQPEVVITLYQDLSGALKKPEVAPMEASLPYKARTLIFSEQGTLLYSELSGEANGALTAIASLGDGGAAALVINQKTNYSLKRWSKDRNRFE
jgi:hypothetical protein